MPTIREMIMKQRYLRMKSQNQQNAHQNKRGTKKKRRYQIAHAEGVLQKLLYRVCMRSICFDIVCAPIVNIIETNKNKCSLTNKKKKMKRKNRVLHMRNRVQKKKWGAQIFIHKCEQKEIRTFGFIDFLHLQRSDSFVCSPQNMFTSVGHTFISTRVKCLIGFAGKYFLVKCDRNGKRARICDDAKVKGIFMRSNNKNKQKIRLKNCMSATIECGEQKKKSSNSTPNTWNTNGNDHT